MQILLAIKPDYAEKILSGEKKYEFRKTIFKYTNVTTILLYATKPVGKVVGYFYIDEILSGSPQEIWRATEKHSGITKRFFDEYFADRNIAYAIKIKSARRYKNPLELSDVISTGKAPQSYCYVI